MVENPFIYGRAVTSEEFLGRQREIQHLFGRLTTRQSVAIIGEPHIGKTSLLKHINAPEIQARYWATKTDKTILSVLDAQLLCSLPSQATFWELALAPLYQFHPGTLSPEIHSLLRQYKFTRPGVFSAFDLRELFSGLDRAGVHFVLLLDEFDSFLAHPVLNSAEFYGTLRSLASFTGGLTLVIATRNRLEQLNQITQPLNPLGSPYFNFFTEICLGALDDASFANLLVRAGDRFDHTDRLYIRKVSGQHPYLAQTAAAMLWNAQDEGLLGTQRYAGASHRLYSQVRQHFVDSWNAWTDATRKAVTILALARIPSLLPQHKFRVGGQVESLDDYSLELEELAQVGVLTRDLEGRWEIAQDSFLWWLADELKRGARDGAPFRAWLKSWEVTHVFTKSEWQKIDKAVRSVSGLVGKGSATLIEALATGFGQSIGNKLAGGQP